jgi:tetratricopeptide (TPR) repeat protein/predicted Ser/Thr protein kinase
VDARFAGHTLADRYDVLELLGTGGMGEVYRARDRELDELVALKVIRTDRADDAELIARFRHEVKLARRVTHKNVARTFELGSADGIMFCTMELIEGVSLSRRLADQRKLSVAEATAIASSVCEGLAAAHAADVIHRDIKPDNVLLASDGRVIVADFGVASIRVRDDGDLSGTPAYMAPEQARGEPPTPAADVYAVGVLLYEMLGGRRAFIGDVTTILAAKQTIDRLVLAPGEIPAELANVIARATARDLAERLPSAVALLRALSPWARPAGGSTTPHRTVMTPGDLHRLIVLAPRPIGDHVSQIYIAEAVHEALLAKLSDLPRVRVQPRIEAPPEAGTIVIALDVGAHLVLTVQRDGVHLLDLRLPLAVEQVAQAANSAASAIAAALVLDEPVRADVSTAAIDLLLQAKHIAQRHVTRALDAADMLERAAVLEPANPRITAARAIMQVRIAFFMAAAGPEVLQRAAALAHAAVTAAPELAESHLAMGHVELHTGDCAVAAAHFRVAIACSPHVAEAHEHLGRLLLEAGHIPDAIARLEDAIAIAPQLRSARWEIARAWALEGRWDDHHRLVAELIQSKYDRSLLRARFAWWRGDRTTIAELRADVIASARLFDPVLLDHLFGVFADGAWALRGPLLMATALDTSSPDLRRRAFVAQLAAEAAAFSGDVDSCNRMIEHAIEQGLFDLHWLDHCPLLEVVHTSTAFAPLRKRVKTRADAILDAFYGDHAVGVNTETVLASSDGLSAARSNR